MKNAFHRGGICSFLLPLLFTAAHLQAQTILRVALLDYKAVLQSFEAGLNAQRITQLKSEAERELERVKNEMERLQEKLETAKTERNRKESKRLEDEIAKWRNYGRRYLESKNQEIAALQRSSSTGKTAELRRILPEIISQVAREQGYSLILDKNSPNLIWFDASIDISETVTQRLKQRLGQAEKTE